ncbi:ABC transporter permease [Abditibacterium utsteinense]|uniref:ABC transporter permease n=1 Tax=Abditibacterium utsteinense TaxID=1960156 RepID=UPI001473FF28|nr:ABC transporter permease [Abditibacterium utsteinense]
MLDTQTPSEHGPTGQEPSGEAQQPHLVIRASSGWAALDLKQIWLYRDLLMTLASRDVKLRYRQTALGVVWVILQPLVAAGIFSFVFGTVAGFPSEGVPYIVFAYAGQLAWNAFSSTVTKSSAVLVANSGLISKVYFPRLVLPLSTVPSTLLDFAVALGMMAVLMVIYGIAPGLGILLLPLWLGLILMLSVGIGLYTSALMVSYRDVQYILPVVTNMLLYASPVAYSASFAISKVPQNLRAYYFLNPLSGLLEAFRWSMIGRGELNWGYIAYSAVFAILIFIGGAFSFKKMERKFADVI